MLALDWNKFHCFSENQLYLLLKTLGSSQFLGEASVRPDLRYTQLHRDFDQKYLHQKIISVMTTCVEQRHYADNLNV